MALKKLTYHLPELSQEEIENQIVHYERTFEMSSEEFLRRMSNVLIEDSFKTMDWMILLRHRQEI